MATKMQQRRGTAAEWAAANPVLAPGEMGFETDTKIIKVGDGTTPWNSLNMPNVATAIPKTLVDAKGDLLVGSADNTVVRLPRGTDGQVLKTSSTTESGLAWGNGGAPTYLIAGFNTAQEYLAPGTNTAGVDQTFLIGEVTNATVIEFFSTTINASYPVPAFYAKCVPSLGYTFFQDYQRNWRRLDNYSGQLLPSGPSQQTGALQVEPGNTRFVKFFVDIPNKQVVIRQANGGSTSAGSQYVGGFNIQVLSTIM